MEIFPALVAIATLFLGLPWLILHYVTRWKQASSLTVEDENLLDELHDIARRLDERLHSIERIIAVDHAQQGALSRENPAHIAHFPRQASGKEI